MSTGHERLSRQADLSWINKKYEGQDDNAETEFLDVNRSALRRKIDGWFGKSQYLTVGQLRAEQQKMQDKLSDVKEGKGGSSKRKLGFPEN